MVIVNTCVVHLGINKLYCTGNLHGNIDYVTEEGLETHLDLNKAHACPGQQQVILFKLSSVFFFKAVFPSSDTV